MDESSSWSTMRFYINMYARTGSGNVPYPVLSNTDKRKKMADHEVVYGWKPSASEFYTRHSTFPYSLE